MERSGRGHSVREESNGGEWEGGLSQLKKGNNGKFVLHTKGTRKVHWQGRKKKKKERLTQVKRRKKALIFFFFFLREKEDMPQLREEFFNGSDEELLRRDRRRGRNCMRFKRCKLRKTRR